MEILNCSFNKLLTIFGRKIVSNLSKEIIIGLSHGIFFNLQINPKLESKGFFTTVTTGPSTPKKFSYFGRTNSKKFWRNPQMSGKTGQCRNFFKRGDWCCNKVKQKVEERDAQVTRSKRQSVWLGTGKSKPSRASRKSTAASLPTKGCAYEA